MVTTSKTVADISARLAGNFLYTSRGIIDPDDTEQNQLKMHKEYAEGVLDDMLAGRIKVSAELRNDITFPTVEQINASNV